MDMSRTSGMTPTSSMSMDMATATSSMIMAASSSAASSMDMDGMDMGGSCKISMTWNWYTIDACFIADTWQITSSGMFAGSCIGVVLLVIVLEALRRGSREYDAFLIRKRAAYNAISTNNAGDSGSSPEREKGGAAVVAPARGPWLNSFRPTLVEQLIRALLHMLQFAVAYFVMLLAMYFNGYIIISILIGAFIGAFAFSWQSMTLPGAVPETTGCCG